MGVVASPEPGHCGWELGVALGSVVGALAEAEVEVVAAGFEDVGHADVGEWPGAPVGVFHIVGAVLEPDADVAVGSRDDLKAKSNKKL